MNHSKISTWICEAACGACSKTFTVQPRDFDIHTDGTDPVVVLTLVCPNCNYTEHLLESQLPQFDDNEKFLRS